MRPHPITILLLLLAGAVANVGVAWGCVRWSPRAGTVRPFAQSRDSAWWTDRAPARFAAQPSVVEEARTFGVTVTIMWEPGVRTGSRGNRIWEQQAGWPARSLGEGGAEPPSVGYPEWRMSPHPHTILLLEELS